MADHFASRGQRALAVDLRGHGGSPGGPPWDLATHVDDVAESTAAAGIDRAVYIGHSYGAVIAAQMAVSHPQRVDALVLLDPPFQLPSRRALASAAIAAQDWSFETVAGAVEAVLASDAVVSPREDVVTAYVARDLRVGSDGRYRFGYRPEAAAAIWREMTTVSPPIAQLPTMLVRPAQSFVDSSAHDRRYRESLGDLVEIGTVPGGHNLLWESPEETSLAIAEFLARLGTVSPAGPDRS
jgi:lipase